jgi:hypothetical protein
LYLRVVGKQTYGSKERGLATEAQRHRDTEKERGREEVMK